MIDLILIGLIILFVIMGILKMNRKRYKIQWLDHKEEMHVLSGLCEHKKDIVQSALTDASRQGKVYAYSIMIMLDKG